MLDWLKANVPWIGSLLAAVFLYFFVKKGPKIDAAEPVPPPTPSPEEEQKKVEEEHAHDVEVVVEQQQVQEKDLEDDPEAENDFIKRVGEDVRKP